MNTVKDVELKQTSARLTWRCVHVFVPTASDAFRGGPIYSNKFLLARDEHPPHWLLARRLLLARGRRKAVHGRQGEEAIRHGEILCGAISLRESWTC